MSITEQIVPICVRFSCNIPPIMSYVKIKVPVTARSSDALRETPGEIVDNVVVTTQKDLINDYLGELEYVYSPS